MAGNTNPGRPQRNFRPRARSTVTERDMTPAMGSGNKGVYAGEHFLNPGIKGIRFMRPDSYKAGCTVVRIWPLLDPEAPTENLLQGRQNAMGPAGLTGMAMSEPVTIVDFAGVTEKNAPGVLPAGAKFSTTSYIEAKSERAVVEGVTFWDLPYIALRQSLARACTSGAFTDGRPWDPRWNRFFSKDVQQTPFPKFKTVYFVFAHVVENGRNLNLEREIVISGKGTQKTEKIVARDGIPYGLKPEDELVIMPVPVSAGKKLLEISCKEKATYVGNPHSPETCNLPYVYGDPCGKFNPTTGAITGGLFYTIYNPKVYTFGGPAEHTTFKGELKDVQDYSVGVSRTVMSPTAPGGRLSADMSADDVRQIFDKSLFMWRDSPEDRADSYALHEPSIEERCVWIATAYKALPDMLKFGWMSHPDYLEFPDVHKIVSAATSVRVPKGQATYTTTAQQQQAPQQPADVIDEFSDDGASVPASQPATKTGKSMPGLQKQVAKTNASAADIAAEFEDASEEVPFEVGVTDEFADAADATGEIVEFDEFDDVGGEPTTVEFGDEAQVSDEFDVTEEEPPLATNVALTRAVARSKGRGPDSTKK